MELTTEQVKRQDFVDNEIHNLVEKLIDYDVEYDIEKIARVREIIFMAYYDVIPLTEQEFYPFIEDDDDFITDELVAI